jgi:hypothetical protein
MHGNDEKQGVWNSTWMVEMQDVRKFELEIESQPATVNILISLIY